MTNSNTLEDVFKHQTDDQFLTGEQAAEYLQGMGIPATSQWLRRYAGKGVKTYKIGHFVRYKVSDLKAFANSSVENNHA